MLSSRAVAAGTDLEGGAGAEQLMLASGDDGERQACGAEGDARVGHEDGRRPLLPHLHLPKQSNDSNTIRTTVENHSNSNTIRTVESYRSNQNLRLV